MKMRQAEIPDFSSSQESQTVENCRIRMSETRPEAKKRQEDTFVRENHDCC